jgi:hypothetical protein
MLSKQCRSCPRSRHECHRDCHQGTRQEKHHSKNHFKDKEAVQHADHLREVERPPNMATSGA